MDSTSKRHRSPPVDATDKTIDGNASLELDEEFFRTHTPSMIVPIDWDIAAWLRQRGDDLQPKINQILRDYMEVQKSGAVCTSPRNP